MGPFATREGRRVCARRPRNFGVALQDRTGHPVQRNKPKVVQPQQKARRRKGLPGVTVEFTAFVYPKDQVNIGTSPVCLVEDYFVVSLGSPIPLFNAEIQVVLTERRCELRIWNSRRGGCTYLGQ